MVVGRPLAERVVWRGKREDQERENESEKRDGLCFEIFMFLI